jgi:glycosyltransferase involved in cell wall biosynthesis
MKTRILFTIPNFITAGSGGAMLNIIRRLDPDRYEPGVCVTRKGGRLDREVEALGIPFIEAPFTVPALPYATLPARAWRAARAFRSSGFEIWHSFHYSDDYTEPMIARLSGARRWVFTKKNMNWKSRAWYLRSLFASRIAAQNTDMLSEFFSSRAFHSKARLVPRGVDTLKFRAGIEPRLAIRKTLGIANHRVVVGTVAHLVPVKGHQALITAIAKRRDLVLVLAGKPLDSEYVEELHALVDRLGVRDRVHFVSDVEDVPAFLSEVDIFCLPSLQEGSPVALLEAMACARACVASDIPGARDMIEHERSGLLVAPSNADELAKALASLESASRRSELGIAARRRVEDHYTIEEETRAHMALYDEIRRTPR